MALHPKIKSRSIEVEGVDIHFLIAGEGDPILFIHGFPTSSYLWRNVMNELLEKHQVIAIDLPGYGQSSKRLGDSYSFRYYERILTSLLNHLEVKEVTLGVHDVGGPIGLFWMVQHMERVKRLILFNTLVYAKFSWGVKLFGLATVVPIIKNWLTSSKGIKGAIRLGVYNKENLTEEVISKYQSPFTDKESRKALLKSVQRLSMKGFKEIESKLPSFKGPVHIIYGENDKILPKVSDTMKKVQKDLPQSSILAIPNCGHFLQEDYPEQIAESISDFMNQS